MATTFRATRVITYTGTEADIRRHLKNTLLSAQREVKPGDVVPGLGMIFGSPQAPQVTISLDSETWCELPPPLLPMEVDG